eukprot:COSAG06_NODE_2023_length_7816_cov_52.135415_3_plen_87_part_00
MRKALTTYLDLSRPPSQQLMLVLGEHAADAVEKGSLLKLASIHGKTPPPLLRKLPARSLLCLAPLSSLLFLSFVPSLSWQISSRFE